MIVADRYYNDFPMLNVWDSSGVFFVIRHKGNLAFSTVKERELPTNTAQHVLKDEEIELTNPQSKTKYPGRLRRVAVWDEENQQTIELITSNFAWAAQTIGISTNQGGRLRCFSGISNNCCTSKPSSAPPKMR